MTNKSNDAETKIEPDVHIQEKSGRMQKKYDENMSRHFSGSYRSETEVPTDVVIVRYGELALKSPGIRNWYEKILLKNIAAMLDSREISYSRIRREWGRIFIETTNSQAAETVADVFGVVSTSAALTTGASLEDAASVCAALGQDFIHDGEFFAIRARKSGNHPFSSVDIAKACGDAVWNFMEKLGKKT